MSPSRAVARSQSRTAWSAGSLAGVRRARARKPRARSMRFGGIGVWAANRRTSTVADACCAGTTMGGMALATCRRPAGCQLGGRLASTAGAVCTRGNRVGGMIG